jgi:hypothetical protein
MKNDVEKQGNILVFMHFFIKSQLDFEKLCFFVLESGFSLKKQSINHRLLKN